LFFNFTKKPSGLRVNISGNLFALINLLSDKTARSGRIPGLRACRNLLIASQGRPILKGRPKAFVGDKARWPWRGFSQLPESISFPSETGIAVFTAIPAIVLKNSFNLPDT
jgi:hypothetical protein